MNLEKKYMENLKEEWEKIYGDDYPEGLRHKYFVWWVHKYSSRLQELGERIGKEIKPVAEEDIEYVQALIQEEIKKLKN